MPLSSSADGRRTGNRWIQLGAGIVCMVMIANLQYGWTLFVYPIYEKWGWSHAAIQVAFTIFVLTETWLVPFEGWFVDRLGPKGVVFLGGVLVAVAWSINSVANSLALLYLGAAVGGIGAGCIYGTCIGNALKWFADRRGLATGLTAAGYGAGSALTIIPIHTTIHTFGYQAAFLWFGLGQGIVICLASLAIASPRPKDRPPPSLRVHQTVHDYTPAQMLRSPPFWLLYVMLVLVASGGLVFTAQLASIARDFHVSGVEVTLVDITLPALTFALTLDRITNGLTRPLSGWISDHFGRENTMFGIFALEAVGVWAMSVWGHDPVMFVVLGGVVFLAWGEVASLFPTTCADYFGTKYATTNAGLLYTAKGTAAMMVPLASLLTAATGHWHAVFMIAVAMNAAAALLAIAVLRPMRLNLAAKSGPPSEPASKQPAT